MNRLTIKCLLAFAGAHLLLLLILFVGPAFFNHKQKADETQLLDVIPANLVDAALNSSVLNAQPPAPTPPAPQPPQPTPPPPKMTVAPAPIPAAQKIEKNKPPETKPTPALRPEDLKPAKKTTPKNAQDNSQKRAQDIKNIIRNLKQNLSQSTTVDMPGTSSVAYANYASVVRSVYDAAWTLPDTVANDEENVKISVTIANDGTVITARIVTPSGDAPVDATVQKALERVKFVAPFPEGATEKERTYVINFNPKAKRLE